MEDREAGSWRGHDLGTRTVYYAENDAILYALAVGAHAEDLDLVHEKRLRVLPTFALVLGQWAPDALGAAGAFDIRTAVHGAQRLDVLQPLPPNGSVSMSAAVEAVWDKGRAAVFDVSVRSDYFLATWSLFAPGRGGFGGERGPARPADPADPAHRSTEMATFENQAALYRLLGDRHAMHIDPAAAVDAGQPKPFLHGLCTLATTALAIAGESGRHPADLVELEGRFASAVFPGDRLGVRLWEESRGCRFDVGGGDRTAISGGRVRFR